MNKIRIYLAVFMVFMAGSAFADHLAGHSVEKRIKPSGSVYVEGDDVPVSKPVVVTTSGTRSSEEIYKASCAACHATDALGAPVFGNADSWKDRIAKGEESLINNAIAGFNAMPPMGTCMTCSKEEIKATVEYMIANSQ